jgi:4-hydroxybenzoate polyprenyltransferase
MLAAIAGHDARGVLAVALAIAASQLAVGWQNDWLDASRDAAAGRADKPIVAGTISRRSVGVAAAIATAATVPLALLSGPAAGSVAAVGLVSCLSYNWPLKATALSVLPYAVSFAALPAFVVLALPGTPAPPWWLLGAGAALGSGAHFANVLPDLDADARTGIRGLPHRLGPGWSMAVAGFLLATAGALLVLGPPGRPAPLAVAGLGVVVAVLAVGWYGQRRRPASRSAFRAVIVAALINVALLFGAGAVG